MSEIDNTPELEQEEEQIEEEVVEEEQDDSQPEEKPAEEVEKLKQENAKLQRLLNKKEKKVEAKKPINKIDEEPEVLSRVERLELSEKKRQFGYQHNLSPDETDKIFQINQDPSEETLKDPFVKAGLDALRKKRRASENTPRESGATSEGLGKDFKNLNAQEKQERYAKMMARHLK